VCSRAAGSAPESHAIRTALNFFLAREITRERAELAAGEKQLSG
jgi:hypothetical protein